MKFWDSSAVVALLVAETEHRAVRQRLEDDPAMLVWWGTPVECVSAIARRERESALDASATRTALARLQSLAEQWHEVMATTGVRTLAERMLRVHPLRSADALQLAAAVVASEHDPASLEFVTLDARLQEAASKEGFRLT